MLAVLKLIRKYWFVPVIVIMWAFIGIQNSKINELKSAVSVCEANRKADNETYKAEIAKAALINKAQVLDTERKWQEVVQSNQKEYNAKLTTANLAVADYVKRLRNANSLGFPTLAGNSNSAGVPPSTNPTSPVDGASSDTVVPVADLYICAENTVKAESWQAWYKGIQEAQPQ